MREEISILIANSSYLGKVNQDLKADSEINQLLYADIKRAYELQDARSRNRIEYLKKENKKLIIERDLVAATLKNVRQELSLLKRAQRSGGSQDSRVRQLESKLRDCERDLELSDAEIQSVRRDAAGLYDIANDAQNYSILIERLLKA